MKKILSVALISTMAFSFAACGGNNQTGDESLSATTAVATVGEGSAERKTVFEIGEYKLEYTDAYLTKDYYENPALVVGVKFTNNSDSARSYAWSVYTDAKQDGAELDVASIFANEEGYTLITDIQDTQIEPGSSADINLAYHLNNETSNVELKFSDLFEENVENLTVVVKDLEHK